MGWQQALIQVLLEIIAAPLERGGLIE